MTGISAYNVSAPHLEGASCINFPTDWFYLADGESDHPEDLMRLIRPLCQACPVRRKCLDHAIENEAHGIWGGLTAAERATLGSILKRKISSTRAKNMVTRDHLRRIMTEMSIPWEWFC